MLALRPTLAAAALALALGSTARAGNEPPRGEVEPAAMRIQGRVLDADGWPLPHARVYALRRADADPDTAGSRPVLETSSDADGRFTLDALVPGSYQIDIEAPGHQATHVGVHLPHGAAPVPPLEVLLWPVTTRSFPGADTPRLPAAASIAPPATPAGAAVRELDVAASAPGPGVTASTPDLEAAVSAAEPVVATSTPEPAGTDTPGDLSDEVRQALAAGQVLQARALLDRADRLGAADADLFYAVGEALLRWGETAAAVAVLDGALARDPGQVEARYRRALGLLALRRREEAREEFERVLEQRRDGPLAENARTAIAELDRTRAAPQ